MQGILDYAELRKDITFQERGFNPVDALIFSVLSYADWEEVVNEVERPLSEACALFLQRREGADFARIFAYSPLIPRLLELLKDSVRYREVTMGDYRNVFDEAQEIQFAAVTMKLPDGALFLSFRGTDCSMIGWKEDMKMTYQESVPAQVLAWEYTRQCAKRHVQTKRFLGRVRRRDLPTLYLGGHSKGGNLAMYAAIRETSLHQQIRKVFNFDGPGFRETFYAHYECSGILSRIVTYLPQGSIIGRLLEHREAAVVIEARESGLSQHDAFCWSVGCDDFILAEGLSEESDKVQDYIQRVLLDRSDEERRRFVDLIFRVMDRLEIRSVSDMIQFGLRQGINGLRELSAMSAEERKFIFDVINFLWQQTRLIFFHPRT